MTETQLRMAEEHMKQKPSHISKPEKLPYSGFQTQALRKAESRMESEAVTHLTGSHSGSPLLHKVFFVP